MKVSDDLQSPLDIKSMFAKYAERESLTPEETADSWEAFKKWYADTLVGLWKRKIGTFFKRGQPTNKTLREKTPEKTLREKSLHELLVSHPDGLPVDVLHRLLRKPIHEVREALQELESQDKATEVGHDVWSAK